MTPLPSASSTAVVRVVVADDDPHVRAALVDLVGDDDRMHIVGAAMDAPSAVELATAEHPDVAVLDVRMPGDGLTAVRELRRRFPDMALIVLSSYSDRHTVGAATEAGATLFLVKGSPESDLVAAIARVAALA